MIGIADWPSLSFSFVLSVYPYFQSGCFLCFSLYQVLLPTLSEFSAQLRAKAAQSMIGTADWPSVGALLSSLLFAEPLLEEWQDQEPLSSMGE